MLSAVQCVISLTWAGLRGESTHNSVARDTVDGVRKTGWQRCQRPESDLRSPGHSASFLYSEIQGKNEAFVTRGHMTRYTWASEISFHVIPFWLTFFLIFFLKNSLPLKTSTEFVSVRSESIHYIPSVHPKRWLNKMCYGTQNVLRDKRLYLSIKKQDYNN